LELLKGELYTLFIILKNITMQGTVKFFNETKGFGFIKPEDSSEDIFVHSTGLIDEIREDDKVEYDMEKGRKGMNAVNVRVID
jgi:CspA family cold shock protein